MSLRVNISGDTAIVHSTHADRHLRPAALLLNLLNESVKTTILDLQALDYIDSAALGEIVSSHLQYEDSGAHLTLVKAPPTYTAYSKSQNSRQSLTLNRIQVAESSYGSASPIDLFGSRPVRLIGLEPETTEEASQAMAAVWDEQLAAFS